jgi:hypothetical protein
MADIGLLRSALNHGQAAVRHLAKGIEDIAVDNALMAFGSTDAAFLLQRAKRTSQIMEVLGDLLDSMGAITDEDGDETDTAFELMQAVFGEQEEGEPTHA